LQGAALAWTQLQGADLLGAELQGAVLVGARLQGANLQKGVFYGSMAPDTELVDARGLKWQSLSGMELWTRLNESVMSWWGKDTRTSFKNAIEKAATPGIQPPKMRSCLRDEHTQVTCGSELSIEKFRELLLPELERLAC
jgi:hypothetical protein